MKANLKNVTRYHTTSVTPDNDHKVTSGLALCRITSTCTPWYYDMKFYAVKNSLLVMVPAYSSNNNVCLYFKYHRSHDVHAMRIISPPIGDHAMLVVVKYSTLECWLGFRGCAVRVPRLTLALKEAQLCLRTWSVVNTRCVWCTVTADSNLTPGFHVVSISGVWLWDQLFNQPLRFCRHFSPTRLPYSTFVPSTFSVYTHRRCPHIPSVTEGTHNC